MNKRMIEKIIGDIAAVATLLTMVRQSDTKEMNPASVTAAPRLICPHWVLCDKQPRGTQLVISWVFNQRQVEFELLEECFVTSYGGGSKEWPQS